MLKTGRMLLVTCCLALSVACGEEAAAPQQAPTAAPTPVAAPTPPPPRPMAQEPAPEAPQRNEVSDEQLMQAMQTYEAKLLQENMTNMIKNNPNVQPTAEQAASCNKMRECNCPDQAIQACGIMVALLDAKLVETGHEPKGRWTYVDQMECIDMCIGRYSNKLQQEYRAMTLKYH